MQTTEKLLSLDPKAYLRKFITSNVRPDKRTPHAVRSTTVVPTILPRNTYGSSLVRLGNTQIISAITLSIGQPPPSLPSSGELDVSVTFSPLCGRRYNIAGKVVHSEEGSSCGGAVTSVAVNASDPQAIESFVKRAVLGSDMVDLTQLCLEEGKSAWKVRISCSVLNHDGNVVDALLLGCVSALSDLKLPLTKFVSIDNNEKDGIYQIILPESEEINNTSLENDRKRMKLHLKRIPIPLTIGVFEGNLLLDPTLAEEAVCDGIITVIVDALTLSSDGDKSNATLLNLQKNGKGISAQRLALCVQLCCGRAEEMKQIFCPVVATSNKS